MTVLKSWYKRFPSQSHNLLNLLKSDIRALVAKAEGRMDADVVTLKRRAVNIIVEAKRRGSALPIHRLVAEVFVEIVLYYTDVESWTISRHYARIRNVALVSTTWAAILFEAPTLWSYIHWRQSHNDLLNSLTRSRGCPLVIEYKRGERIDERIRSDERLVPFVDRAHREIRQWRTKNLTISDAQARASKLLLWYLRVRSAPFLKKRLLNSSSDTPPSQLISPFRLVAYRLQALPSWDVPIDWASPQLTKLETLILYGEISADSPTASQLAQVLRACPGLVRLEICYEPDMTEAVPTDMSPIELPVLTVFDMEVSPAIATYILAIIRLPACENFSIVVLNPRSTFLPDALQHHTSVLASLAASSAFTDISMSEYDFRYKADEAVSIRLIAPESQLDSLIWMVNHIHPPTLSVPARLIIGTPDFPVSALALHRLACSVTKLEVYKNSDIIPYLGQLVTVEGARRFPLPNLLELSLAAFTSLEPLDVALMVEHRLGGIRSESRWARLQSNDWPEVPVKLRKVHLPEACGLATSKAAVKRLKRFVDGLWFGRGSLEVEEQELSDDSDYGDWSDDSDYDDYNYYDYWSDGSADWFCHHDGGSEYSGDDRWAFSW